jgi:membrane-bound lytic murein transglycosylase D
VILLWLSFFFRTQTFADTAKTNVSELILKPQAQGQVSFWKKVFSEWDSHDAILHDCKDLQTVYEIRRDPQDLKAWTTGWQRSLKERGLTEASKCLRVQRGQKDRIQSGFELSKRYMGRIEEILEEEGVPKSLSRLIFMESGFIRSAKSPVGALGIWQIMPNSAAERLRITRSIDERRDPLKSTRAAGYLLKQAYDALGSWPLAIMAYHHGTSLVKKAIRQVNSKDPVRIITEFKDPNFGFASRNYFYEFLALEGITLKSEHKLPEFIVISFPRRIYMRQLLKNFPVTETDTRMLNPHFLEPIWQNRAHIPASYPIRISGISLEEFKELSKRTGIQ